MKETKIYYKLKYFQQRDILFENDQELGTKKLMNKKKKKEDSVENQATKKSRYFIQEKIFIAYKHSKRGSQQLLVVRKM